MAPRNLEEFTVHFETTIESNVALDVHAIVQKWDSFFFQTIYHGLLINLADSLNFRIMGRICENRENYAPKKFGTIQYVYLHNIDFVCTCVSSTKDTYHIP